MSNKGIDLTQFEGMEEWEVEKRPDGGYAIKTGRDNFSLEEAETIAKLPTLIAELKRCYKQNDLLTKAFMMAGNNGCYMTMCEECDDVHTPDDECPFVCEHCDEKKCECSASE